MSRAKVINTYVPDASGEVKEKQAEPACKIRQTENMKTEIINNLISYVKDNCEQINREAHFDDMLDECYSFKDVGGPFAHMSPSRVLAEVDPVAYRCGVNDYEDSMGWIDIGGVSYDGDSVETARESFIETLETDISDLEQEIEDEEKQGDSAGLDAMRRELADKQADLKAVKEYTF